MNEQEKRVYYEAIITLHDNGFSVEQITILFRLKSAFVLNALHYQTRPKDRDNWFGNGDDL